MYDKILFYAFRIDKSSKVESQLNQFVVFASSLLNKTSNKQIEVFNMVRNVFLRSTLSFSIEGLFKNILYLPFRQ
jgi:hypothetical protein